MSATIFRRRETSPFLAHVALKDGGERVPVRDVEHPQRRDRHVNIDGIDVHAEAAFALAARDHAPEPVDDGAIERAHGRRLLEMTALGLVLGHDEPHEALVIEVVVVGELDDAPDRLRRLQMVQVEEALGMADLGVHMFQHRQVQLLLAAEVVVDQRARRVRARGDGVHAGALEAARGEFVDRRLHDAGAVGFRRLGLAHRRGARGDLHDALGEP